MTGNHYENFRDVVNFFVSRNAVRIVGLAELPLVLMELIDSDSERATLGRNALAALESQRGATDRTVVTLLELMGNFLSQLRLSDGPETSRNHAHL